MKELLEYRQKMINRLETAAGEFRAACQAVRDPFVPVHAGGWTVHQVAEHVRDVDHYVYTARIQRTVTEQNPEFEDFDQDAWMAGHYNPREPLQPILREFTSSVGGLVKLLRSLPPEAWSRESRHEVLGGGFTTQLWVERALAHIEEHLAAVRKIADKLG